MLDDLLRTLNSNAGAIAAVSTAVYVVFTLAIVLEARAARNLRLDAVVDARLRAHPPASMLLELDVRNLGPAIARDVVIEYWFTDLAGHVVGERRRQGELGLAPHEGRRFLPMDDTTDFTAALAKADRTIHVRWGWTDDRRGFRRRPIRHERAIDVPASRLERDFFGGWALTDPDPDGDREKLVDAVRKLEGHARGIREELARLARRDVGKP